MTTTDTICTPDTVLASWTGIKDDDFAKTIRETFGLPAGDQDEYVYRAESFAMTLGEIEARVKTGSLTYKYQFGHTVIEIPSADIKAYTTIFAPSTDTTKALTSFIANAKKASPRENVAQYLSSRRLLPSTLKLSKSKTHINPYYDVWVHSCHSTGFVGPLGIAEYGDVQAAKMTHPMLPVLYHHFGCVCPSWEGLSVVRELVLQGGLKGVLDMASGNGYWTFMLRRLGLDVVAVDNGESTWRYNWIGDTVKMSGTDWLRRNQGAGDRVLLMVYMVTRGDFTKQVLKTYTGQTIVVVGTQNENRYTSFRDVGVEEYFAREKRDWKLTVRVALPSFAGKDEALYVFQKKTS